MKYIPFLFAVLPLIVILRSYRRRQYARLAENIRIARRYAAITDEPTND